MKKTILQFITSLRLSRLDECVLIQHVEDCQVKASGPGLNDKCTDRVRRFLKSRPPPAHLSWNASIKLEDALNAGFTSKQAYKMGIPAIGIVAVLVANVTFVGWTSSPGGNSPYWQGCDYPMFTAFLIVNGFAFMLSVASVIVVTAFPLVLNRTPQQAAWWGGVLLIVSMLAFIVAFLLAGFVTVGYQAPPQSCASLRCTQGGISCDFAVSPYSYDPQGKVLTSVFSMDPNVALLNGVRNSDSAAACVTYNQSISHGTYSTLYPWVTSIDFTSNTADRQADEAITQLLTDPVLQAETVCMDVTNLPDAIDPHADTQTLAVNVSYDIPNLGDFLTINEVTLFDILPNNSFTQLFPYLGLPHLCLSSTSDKAMRSNVLCDTSVQSTAGNLSVSKTGAYIQAQTAADSGAVLFDPDITAHQVSLAVKALAGVFALILLIIITFLFKSKLL